MANFCTNCGFKLEDNYNFCINCGAKINKSDIKQYNPSFNQYSDTIEKKKAKQELKRVVGGRLQFNKTFADALLKNGLDVAHDGKAIRHEVEKEIDSGQIKRGGVEVRLNQLIHEYKIKKEEEKKKLKTIDEIFESPEIKFEISSNSIDQTRIIFIKNSLKNKIVNNGENMSEEEIRYFIKTELKKAGKEIKKAKIAKANAKKTRIAREKETSRKEMERTHGGYCGLGCRHCYEEFLDSSGGIVGDFDSEGYVEYYCRIGHPVSYGSFCEYYE